MVTQTVALLLLLAALAASGLCAWSLAWFLYSDLPEFSESWPVLRVYQVHTAPWPAIVPPLRPGQVVAVRSADVDLSVIFTHADLDPAQLPVPSAQDDVTL
jgi:hypothetical protein